MVIINFQNFEEAIDCIYMFYAYINIYANI